MVRSIGEVPYFEVTAEKMLDDIVPAEAGVQFSAYPDKLLRPFGFILNSEYQFCLEVMDESGNTHKLPFVSFSDEIRVSNQRLPRPNLIFRYFKPEVGPEFEPVAEYSGEGSEFVPLYRVIEPTGIFYGRHPNHREPEEPSFYIVGSQHGIAIPSFGKSSLKDDSPGIRTHESGQKAFPLPRIYGLLGNPEDELHQALHGLY